MAAPSRYFHHIFNKEKRAHIMQWARDYAVTGFMAAGKPGIIVVEGQADSVQAFIQSVRRLPWQKMQSRAVQCETCALREVDSMRKFASFTDEECCGEGTHLDVGAVRRVLELHGVGDVFSVLFGL